MKKYIALLIVVLTTLFTVDALAFTPPPPPANGGYVVDQTGKLSALQIQKLNQKIEQINQSTKNEFGILLLPTMNGDNIEDVANSTYKAWGVGKRGLDNGCLIVVSVKERKSRIETGKGVEGDVPDLKASDILKTNLNPHLKRGDFYGGFDDTLSALSSLIESRHNQQADPPPVPRAVDNTPQPVSATNTNHSTGCDVGGVSTGTTVWLGAFIFLAVVALFWMRRSARKREEEEHRLQMAAAERRRQEYRKRIEEDRKRIEQEELTRKVQSMQPAPPFSLVEQVAAQAPTTILPPPLVSTRRAVPRPSPRPVMKTSHAKPTAKPSTETVAVTAEIAAAAAMAMAADRQARAQREREEREAAERRARQRREREEREASDRRRREEESNSSSSSSFSFDWGSSSSSGSDSGGSGFGGGDSGGGGSSSDW